jgi:threonine dehydrogenase-like Zn-dependent dehydrogenase
MADRVLIRDPQSIQHLGVLADAASEYAFQQRRFPEDLPLESSVLSISLSEVHSWLGFLGSTAGKTVVILGTGIVGYGLLIFCCLQGAAAVVVLGRRESRLAKARVLGATDAFLSDPANISTVQSALDGPADFLLDSSGDPTALAAWLPVIRPGGVVAAYGIPDSGAYTIPLGNMPQGASFLAPRPKEVDSLEAVWEMQRAGTIPESQLITHLWRWPQGLSEGLEAIRRGEVIKGIILWDENR